MIELIAAATDAVEKIIEDLTDRKGLRHEWENIEDEIQAEIETAWANIIIEAVSKATALRR